MKKLKTVDHYAGDIPTSKLFELLEIPKGVDKVWFWNPNTSSGMFLTKNSLKEIKFTAELEVNGKT